MTTHKCANVGFPIGMFSQEKMVERDRNVQRDRCLPVATVIPNPAGTTVGLQTAADIPFCEFILIISEFCLVILAENPNQNERDVSFM